MKSKVLLKRIMFSVFLVVISISCYTVINIIRKNESIISTNALPITNRVIVIDAGHGKPDEGASGFFGATEEAINLQIALKLQKLVEQSGGKVILTRSYANGIYASDVSSIRNKKVSDIKNRVQIGNTSNGSIFVSIHLNKLPASESYSGWQVFYQENNNDSKILAQNIQDGLNNNIQKDNNRSIMKIKNIYIMDNLKIPSVIVECGFLSNKEECEALKTEEYQNKIVWGIYLGIQKYFLNLGEKNEQ